MRTTALLTVIFALALATSAAAEIYRYRGPDGRLIYSNTPPPPSAQVERTRSETVRKAEPAPVAKPAPKAAPAPAPVPKPVVIVREVPAKREEPKLSYREYKRRYFNAHHKYGKLDTHEVDGMLARYKSRLLYRDTENNSTRGREAIAKCERKYNNDRSRLACLVVHYGG